MKFVVFLKKLWFFIWHDDSLLSWIVNLVLAFVLVKFIIYPGFGALLGTNYPIVAVVSGSMEHRGLGFDNWWEKNKDWYQEHNIDREMFEEFSFKDGFNKGDIMILKGIKPKDIKIGDVLVYENSIHSNPIIHRVVEIKEGNRFITKGDNNPGPDGSDITENQIKKTGKAVIRVPLLGWIKIWFVSIFKINL